jgi:hypothetical protein
VAFWGVKRALQSDIKICFSHPACISPLINEDLPGISKAGVYFREPVFWQLWAAKP